MNKVVITGRPVCDIEKRSLNELLIASFRIAVDRPYRKNGKKETDYFPCTAFGQTANYISSYIKKGDLIEAEGSLRTSNYVSNKTGEKVYKTEIVIEHARVISRSPNREDGNEEVKDITGWEEISQDEVPFI